MIGGPVIGSRRSEVRRQISDFRSLATTNRWTGLPREKRQNQGDNDPVEQRLEPGLVVRQSKIIIAFGYLKESRSKYRAEQCAKREIEEVDDSSRCAAQLRRICFLDDRVRQGGFSLPSLSAC